MPLSSACASTNSLVGGLDPTRQFQGPPPTMRRVALPEMDRQRPFPLNGAVSRTWLRITRHPASAGRSNPRLIAPRGPEQFQWIDDEFRPPDSRMTATLAHRIETGSSTALSHQNLIMNSLCWLDSENPERKPSGVGVRTAAAASRRKAFADEPVLCEPYP